jgi:hypothetical protein
VTKLAFLIREGKVEDGWFQVNLSNKFSSITTDLFELIFELSVNDPFFELNLTSSFIFKCDQGITEEFKTSDFPGVQAPAIARGLCPHRPPCVLTDHHVPTIERFGF